MHPSKPPRPARRRSRSASVALSLDLLALALSMTLPLAAALAFVELRENTPEASPSSTVPSAQPFKVSDRLEARPGPRLRARRTDGRSAARGTPRSSSARLGVDAFERSRGAFQQRRATEQRPPQAGTSVAHLKKRLTEP